MDFRDLATAHRAYRIIVSFCEDAQTAEEARVAISSYCSAVAIMSEVRGRRDAEVVVGLALRDIVDQLLEYWGYDELWMGP